MKYDFNFAERSVCDKDMQRDLFELINTILEYSEIARIEGLLSLEDILDKVTNPLLKKGIQLVVDGIDPDVLRKILDIRIMKINPKSQDLLACSIIYEGVIAIQRGDSVILMLEILTSFLDVDLAEKYIEQYYDKQVEMFHKDLHGKPFLSEATKLIEVIADDQDDEIKLILRETPIYDLMNAMLGASGKVQKRILKNMSDRSAQLLISDIVNIDTDFINEECIVEAQTNILRIRANILKK